MYEGRLGAYEYTIERRLDGDGHSSWMWRVLLAGEVVATGDSARSHAHAETEAQSFIFLTDTKEPAARERPARYDAALG